MVAHIKEKHVELIKNKAEPTAISLRNIIRNPMWWLFVVIVWILSLLGIFSPVQQYVSLTHPLETDVTLAVDLTILVAVVKFLENLTRPPISLRSIVRSDGWWRLVIVFWLIIIVAFPYNDPYNSPNYNYFISQIYGILFYLTIFVIIIQVLEHLTRP